MCKYFSVTILKSLTPVFSLVRSQERISPGAPGLLQGGISLHLTAPAQGLVSGSHVQRKLWAQAGAVVDVLTLENLTLESCATHMNFDRRNTGLHFLKANE